MPLWIGRYAGCRNDWFLAWGATRETAVAALRSSLGGEPDPATARRVDGEGGLWFRAEPHPSPWVEMGVSFYRPSGTHGRLPLVFLDDATAGAIREVVGTDPAYEFFRRAHERLSGARRAEDLVRLVAGPVPQRACRCRGPGGTLRHPCEVWQAPPTGRGKRCFACGHVADCHALRP